MDALWAPTVGYADDVIILSSTKDDGVKMLVDCTEISAELGLDVGMEKTNWTSTEPRQNEVLKIGKDEVKWSGSITFLGRVLEFGGRDAKALQYRTGQATTKIAISDFLEIASSGQEDECLQDCDRILADLLAGTWHLTSCLHERLAGQGGEEERQKSGRTGERTESPSSAQSALRGGENQAGETQGTVGGRAGRWPTTWTRIWSQQNHWQRKSWC